MKTHYLICVKNKGYEASLDTAKVYEQLTDRSAKAHDQVRVVDESGEDYLYPASFFAPVRLPAETKEKLELLYA